MKSRVNAGTSKTGKTFVGRVLSDRMKDSLVVVLEYKRRHPVYKKVLKKRHKIYVDNNLSAKTGDLLRVKETRPKSKLKRFTTIEIIKNS